MIGQLVAGILRTVLMTVGGAQVGQGWLSNDQLQQIVGAVLTLVAVGWQIVAAARRRTKAGGEWNPHAEVRRAVVPGEQGEEKRVPRSSTRRMDGYVRLPALVAAGVWACGFAGIFWLGVVGVREVREVRQDAGLSDQDGRGPQVGRSDQDGRGPQVGLSGQDGRGPQGGQEGSDWRVERFPDVTETVDLTGRRQEVLRWRVPIDERGFAVRVFDSLGLWGDAGRDRSGAACYAVGVQGGAEF